MFDEIPEYIEDSPLHYYAPMFPEGVSHWGRWQLFEPMRTDQTLMKAHFELLAEHIRRAYYPERLSRMQALFAYETIEDAQLLIAELNVPSCDVWEVEGEVGHRGDKFHLHYCSPAIHTLAMLHRYWEGAASPSPVWEVLLRLPVRVVRKVG